jgi:heme exporter protein C
MPNRAKETTDSVLLLLTLVSWIWALYGIFLASPIEKTMGVVQKIFYIHVPSAWIAFLAFFVVCVTSILYLRSREARWDRLALASAEIGVFFTTLVLLTGPLWAKPVWNTFWTWDARLSTSLILWLIYIAYLLIRKYTLDATRAKQFAAVFGIIGFLDVPVVYMSIRWWRTLHPAPVIAGGAESGLSPAMLETLIISLAAVTLLFVVLLRLMTAINGVKEDLEHLYMESIHSKG